MACIRDDGYHVAVDFNTVMRAKRVVHALTSTPVRYLHSEDGKREFYVSSDEEAVACFDLWGNLVICGDVLAKIAKNPEAFVPPRREYSGLPVYK
tara:strand:+ start:2646 stop:2930 length:285 start_codon:yes stop_codon:yes gene_type:complete